MPDRPLSRRTLLARATVAAGALAGGGCLDRDDGERADAGSDGSGDAPEFAPPIPEIEDPPDAVYLPTHREAMHVLEPVRADPYVVSAALTYPHTFWLATGDAVERVDPADGDVHLMLSVRDRETGVAVPVDASASLEVSADGDPVSAPNAWPMLSQAMGFHFGDNVPLDGDGTYRVEGRIAPLSARTTGAFAGRFDGAATVAFEFVFDDEMRSITREVEYFDEERWGEPGAVEPMGRGGDGRDGDRGESGGNGGNGGDHSGNGGGDDPGGHDRPPRPGLAPAEDLPGRLQGTPKSGDAVLATTILEPGSRFVDGDERYLAVSARTPYNRWVLPLMGLEATVAGERRALRETLDDELGHHYGTALPAVEGGDELEIDVRAPPQVARHRGYERAFVEMPPVALEVSP